MSIPLPRIPVGIKYGTHRKVASGEEADIRFVSTQVRENSTPSASFTFDVPSNLRNGDLAVLCTFKSSASDPTYPGESFTQLANSTGTSGTPDRGVSIAYKTITDASAEISGATWTFTSAGSHDSIAFLAVIRGANATPISDHVIGSTSSALAVNARTHGPTSTADSVSLRCSVGFKSSSITHEVTAFHAEAAASIASAAATATNDLFGGMTLETIEGTVVVPQGDWTVTNDASQYTYAELHVEIDMT